MAYFGGYPYGYGYGYGPRFGYNPYFTLPVLQSNIKLGGLVNEYNELNDVANRNNYIYYQNSIDNSRCCKYKNRELPLPPPPLSTLTQSLLYPSFYSNPLFLNPYNPFI